jgi:splicing suppressor protein 51
MDAQDKTRFEIQGKSSVKYHLKANHVVEAKRWFWALNNAIQWAKDEAREDDKRRTKEAESLRQAKIDQYDKQASGTQIDALSTASGKTNGKGLAPPSSLGVPSTGSRLSFQTSRGGTDSGQGEDDVSVNGPYEPGLLRPDLNRATSQMTTTVEGDADEDGYGDYASSREMQPSNRDAFNITAQSVKLQLELIADVSSALQAEKSNNPSMTISDPSIDKALSAYEGAISSLNSLIADLLKISGDRDAFWQYRLDREADARKMWEDSMARVAREHDELQSRIGESEEKRKRTRRALKEALENASASASTSRPMSQGASHIQISEALDRIKETTVDSQPPRPKISSYDLVRRKSVITEFTNLSDTESDEDDEFFDAVEAGEVEILTVPPVPVEDSNADIRALKRGTIVPSFQGYEEPLRTRLKLDADDRPKISLWVSVIWTIGGVT